MLVVARLTLRLVSRSTVHSDRDRAIESSEPARCSSMPSHRTWRIAVTVGPLVAIALSLAAGLKWH